MNWRKADQTKWDDFGVKINQYDWFDISDGLDMEEKLKKLYSVLEEGVSEIFDNNLEKTPTQIQFFAFIVIQF